MKDRCEHLGFTLIEMLLALTLTAILLTIVSVTLGAVLRDGQRLERMQSQPLWLESVVGVIRRDLREAETYQITSQGLVLHAHAGIQGALGQADHDPVTIEYRLIKQQDTQWLVRQVRPGTPALTDQTYPFELLCGGIQTMHLAAWSGDEDSPAAKGVDRLARQAVQDAMSEPLPIPGRVMLSITLTPSKDVHAAEPGRVTAARSVPQAQAIERLIVVR